MNKDNHMPRVMLIGDSIRLSYNDRVASLLEGRARVWGPPDNCRFAKYTLWSINEWLNMGGIGQPDIIHWNNGIWDAFSISERIERFTPVDEYIRTLSQILAEMRPCGAKIIFALTTPVPTAQKHCSNDVIDIYNRSAAELMLREGIEINDLNSVVRSDISSMICGDNLHLSEAGIEQVSLAVAHSIEKYL